MVKRILENGLNTSDDGRLVNANAKITLGGQNAPFSFDDNVLPVMVAGVEENVNLSTIDLINCIRDQNGNNRLTVNTRGVPSLSKEQISVIGVNYVLTTDTAVPLLSTNDNTIPKGKILYITGLLFVNGSTTKVHQYIGTLDSPPQGTSGDYINLLLQPSTSLLISNLMIPVYTNDVINIQALKLTDANTDNDSVSIYGFIQ